VRSSIAETVRQMLGGGPDDLDDYGHPVGDPGLFGPGSVAWEVHRDLPSMLYGGFSALMFQTLHPLAMAGVAAHSNFRHDPTGRLRRTARFVAGTTFGSEEFAERLFAEVRAVHQRVVGVAQDGRPYSASDPDLLTFVHTTEAYSFLRSHQRYGGRPLVRAEKDRYFAETAVIARRLGATDVPESLTAVRGYFASLADELAATPDALDTLRFLRRPPAGPPAAAVAYRIVIEAAIDLLPGFAQRLLGQQRGARLAIGPRRAGALALAHTLRWALGPSIVAEAASARAGAR
jgi:uncharacterized protein (DUF2236 family)